MIFMHSHWALWPTTVGFYLSNEKTKQLYSFATINDAINWLFINE